MVLRGFPRLALVAVLLLLPVPAFSDDVAPGSDLFRTVEPSYQDFTGPFEIPADFFDPGSDPFTGRVNLQGAPLYTSPECPGNLGSTDTIIRRTEAAELPSEGSLDTVPVEIIQLQLQSAAPITVTYNGGATPEPWDLRMSLSGTAPSTGAVTMGHWGPSGGTFDPQLLIIPFFTFTRQSDGAVRTRDGGALALSEALSAQEVFWEHEDPTLSCPACVSNFFADSFTAAGGLASFSWMAGCPPVTPVTGGTWGGLKAVYR